MDWRLLGIAAPGFVAIAALVHWLTGTLGPMPGYFLAILIYNLAILLPLSLWKLGPAGIKASLAPRRPGWMTLVLLLAVPLALFGMVLVNGSAAALPVGALAMIALVSLTNGTLEEVFWRGALPDRTDLPAIGLALAAFTLWHLALLPAQGATLTGGPPALLGGAALLGAIWMASRVQSGTVGAGAISHVALNLFAFADLWGAHLPGPGSP